MAATAVRGIASNCCHREDRSPVGWVKVPWSKVKVKVTMDQGEGEYGAR